MVRLIQIWSISQSIVRTLIDAIRSAIYLPLAPAVLYFIIRTQLSHDLYVLRTDWNREYDYIVIGAGSAGSVMASRLSEDSSVTVLLLEAGVPENIVSDVPMAALVLQRTPMDWSYKTTPQNRSCFGMYDRRGLWPRGKAMGGSSTLNTMVYMRGNPHDYNNWAHNGATSWSWPEVFPYFIKAEDNRDPSYVATGYHGVGGPLAVTSPQAPRKVSLAFAKAGPYLGYPEGDVNGPTQQRFTLPQRTIRDGLRGSAARSYLETLKGRHNLHILVRAFVRRILFDENKRAIGVEFDRYFGRYTVKARKQVILSAGAINTPQILMLSGIGPKEHLSKLGIPVISDLRVGDNLQEHYLTGIPFVANESIAIDIFHEVSPWNIYDYFVSRNNSLTNNLVEGTLFHKTKYANPSTDWPDVQIFMLPATLATDFGVLFYKLQGMIYETWRQVYEPYMGLSSFSLYPVVMRPVSRGWIRLKSTDPYEHPSIEANIFGEEQDLNVLVEGMKFALSIAQTPPFQKYNVKPFHTKFPGCESFEIYSDAYLACMARVYTYFNWHPCCTAKMGNPSDPTVVVDPQLRVKGVTNLRVVDGSVMPVITTGNLNAPIIMIAEKVADLIKGRRLVPFVPPMSKEMISRLPYLPYQTIL